MKSLTVLCLSSMGGVNKSLAFGDTRDVNNRPVALSDTSGVNNIFVAF